MSGNRGEDIPAMEGTAHGVAEVLTGGDGPNHGGRGCGENLRQDAVIGRNEKMATGFGQDRLAGAAHAGVHNGHMNRPRGEAGPGLGQHRAALCYLPGVDFVSDINNVRVAADAQDHALHGANVVIGGAKVGKKGDDGAFHNRRKLNWSLAQHYYFDHNATTPVAPEVLGFLRETMAEVYGNASSIHYYGQAAKRHLEGARRALAARFQCDPREIVFTSGGTEADNLAIFGIARRKPGSHVITSAVEHPGVLNACAQLEREGHDVTLLPVDGAGLVSPDDVGRALRPNTALITVMHANNETGVLQPVEAIAAIARDAGITCHCDGVQTAGRVPLHLNAGPDLVSISGHKFGAPKGIGALYVRKGVELQPLFYGGHHERDRRAGTENVPGAAALGFAAANLPDWTAISTLRDRLEQGILARVPAARVNGGGAERIPNTTNIRFDGIEGEAMVIALDLRGYAVSSGSACSSGAVEPSHVLLAMGLSPSQSRSSVRFSLGPANTEAEVDGLLNAVSSAVEHLRRISPEVVHG